VSAISTIAFVGLGNIGFPMVRNLLKAGFSVRTFDLSADAVAATERDGAKAALTMRDAVANVDCVFTMLPMGHDVEAVFRGDEGLLAMTRSGALLVDSSTISSAISRALSVEAKPAGDVCSMRRSQAGPPARMPGPSHSSWEATQLMSRLSIPRSRRWGSASSMSARMERATRRSFATTCCRAPA
jgi:hypothetical protein